VKADRAKLLESSTVVTNKLREELTENTRYYTGRLNEAGATIGIFKDKLAAAQAKNQRLHNDLNSLQAQVTELRSQLETERTDQEEIEVELSEKKQNSVPAARLSEKLTPDAATVLSQLRARRKKSKTELADLEAILEILKS
jgi:ATP-dependent protease HslVU (ClpYQ) ATPase subunit